MPAQPFPVFVTKKQASSSPEPGAAAAAAEIIQIRWNNDDRASLPALHPGDTARFYAAARKWVEILRRPESEYWVQLQPGRPISKCPLFTPGGEKGREGGSYVGARLR